jgi:triosephosphate isomerase
MRKKIVAGNWKMNLNKLEAQVLFRAIDASPKPENIELIIFPVSVHLGKLADVSSTIALGVQNFYPEVKGAFTGELSVTQAKDSGAEYALIGHSERRSIFGEDAELLRSKVDAAIEHGLVPVFCCGEPLELREIGEQDDYVKAQLIDSLFHLDKDQILKCIIAYEPVWAIGTGITATSDQAEEMHAAIRQWLEEKYGRAVADIVPILYGGSCNPSNAGELFACPNVDGGLIGGASLDAISFMTIAGSF